MNLAVPHKPDLAADRERLLWDTLTALSEEAVMRREREAALEARIAELEARSPPPLAWPPGWKTIKAAAHDSGWDPQTIYAWRRNGRVESLKIGGRIKIDPSTIRPK